MRTFHTAHNCSLELADLRWSRGQTCKTNKKVTGQVHGRHTIKLNDPEEVLNLGKL